MKHLPLILMAFTLTGCSVSTALVVQTEDQKDPLMGTATASLTRGDFAVENLSGMSCNGTYDQFTQSPVLKVNFVCNDGRTGSAQVVRTGANLENGSGSGKLSDGTRFKILMGDSATYASQQGYWSKF